MILYDEWFISRVNVDTYSMNMDPIWGWIPFEIWFYLER